MNEELEPKLMICHKPISTTRFFDGSFITYFSDGSSVEGPAGNYGIDPIFSFLFRKKT